jgi:hypothetical protein
MSETIALLSNPAVWKAAFASIGQSPIVAADATEGQTHGEDDDDDIGETSRTSIAEVRGGETDRWVDFASYYAVQLVGLAGLLAGLVSFYLMAYHFLAEFASVFVMIFGVLVGYQKTKLIALGDFRGQHGALKQKVHVFHDENVRLKASIDALAVQTAQLKQVEVALTEIAAASGQNTDALVAIVRENGQLQQEIIQKLQSEVTMQIMTAILQTDRDQNFILSAGEVNQLVMRLQNIPGVEFRESTLRRRVGADTGDLTLTDVCAMAHDYLLPQPQGRRDDGTSNTVAPNNNDDDRIFVFRPRSVLQQQQQH